MTFPRLKGIAISRRYPVVLVWSKQEQILDIINNDQLLQVSNEDGEWQSLWLIKEEFIHAWNDEKNNYDIEDDLIFEDMYQDLLPTIFGLK